MSAAKIPTVIVEPLDALLKPLGFRRKRLAWNRERDRNVDVLDVQLGKSGSDFTINVGVFVAEVYRTCWGKEAPAVIQETDCAVRSRLGLLDKDGHDVWWPTDDPADAVQRVQSEALSFFDGIRTLSDIETALERTLPRRPDRPVGMLYLAIVKALLNRREEAEALLDEVAKIPAWKARVEEVRTRLP